MSAPALSSRDENYCTMTANPSQLFASVYQQSLCFARKVCHFAMKGLPLSLPETTSGFLERSTEA
jgi:hypothetical protein